MGFRDDLYSFDNIYGITGPVDKLPSVYFKNAATGEFGHITQMHGKDWNAGRTWVKTDPGWQIVNKCMGGCKCNNDACAHEIDGDGHCFHHSRNLFVARNDLNPDELSIAAQAIRRCPFQKSDPHQGNLRKAEVVRFEKLWEESHAPRANGRRGAIDYTASGLANRVFNIAYADREEKVVPAAKLPEKKLTVPKLDLSKLSLVRPYIPMLDLSKLNFVRPYIPILDLSGLNSGRPYIPKLDLSKLNSEQ